MRIRIRTAVGSRPHPGGTDRGAGERRAEGRRALGLVLARGTVGCARRPWAARQRTSPCSYHGTSSCAQERSREPNARVHAEPASRETARTLSVMERVARRAVAELQKGARPFEHHAGRCPGRWPGGSSPPRGGSPSPAGRPGLPRGAPGSGFPGWSPDWRLARPAKRGPATQRCPAKCPPLSWSPGRGGVPRGAQGRGAGQTPRLDGDDGTQPPLSLLPVPAARTSSSARAPSGCTSTVPTRR